jgi:hypothetical protein
MRAFGARWRSHGRCTPDRVGWRPKWGGCAATDR